MDFRSLRILFLLPLLWVEGVWAVDCPNTNYDLRTQAQVDSFVATGCDTISGSLSIASDSYYRANLDLGGLTNLISVGGTLSVTNQATTNLDGLANLTNVGGDLYISVMHELENIDGLVSLVSIGGKFEIKDNPVLTDLDGLANLSSVGDDLWISRHDILSNIDGLLSLTSVGGDLRIFENDVLTNIDGLVGLTRIGRELTIALNPALRNIDGLLNLASLGGSVLHLAEIHDNGALQNLDGLTSLTHVNGFLRIYRNGSLENIDGLANLTSVLGELRIYSNYPLSDLDGLASLTSIGGALYLSGSNLTNCQGLALVLGWPSGPANVSGGIDTSSAGIGCRSVSEILASVSGPTKPVIADTTITSGGLIYLGLTPSATTDTAFPITGYQASCDGLSVDVSESNSINLPDHTPITKSLTVAGYDPVSVTSPVTISLDITHSDPTDLFVTLTSPQGTTLTLWDRGSAGGENLVGTFPTTLTPVDSLDAVASEAKDGDWILTVEDVDVGPIVREGVLNSWGLQFKETITVTGEASPLTIEGMQMGRDYSCTVSPITKLGVTPASEPLTVQISPALPFIERFYVNILGRPSDVGGLNAWLNVINTQSASTVVLGFLNSPEFLAKNLDDAAFVDILYRTLFDREGDTGGVEYWLSELASGRLRDMVIWGFLRAAEFKTLSDSFGVTALNAADESAYGIRAFVERFYTLVLGRQPDRGGFDTWVTALTNGTYAGGDIARAFFLSPEYLGQNTTNEVFVETAYRAFFGREADPAGKEGWLDVLAQGQSREYVLNGFIGSAEFAALAASYGINPISTPTTTYTVTASASTGGSINPSGTQTVAEGGTVSFTLAADSGYSFSTISGTCPSGQVLGADYTTGSITGDCTVVAEFTANTTSGYCAGTPTGVICDPNSDGRRDPGGTMDSWSGGDWGFENTPIPNGKVVAYPFLANAGAAGLEGFMEFSNNMPDLWNTGYQWKGWFSESPGGAVLNNNDSYCRKYSPNPNPNEIRWSQAATPNRFSCNLGQAERVLYFNMAVDCYEELSIGCTVGVPFPGIGGYEAYYIKVYPRGWRRTQKAGDAEAIPTLPMLALFIFSGLLGLFGTRRLASR